MYNLRMPSSTVNTVLFVALGFGFCFSSHLGRPVFPGDFFDDFTQGTPLRYVVNLSNCMFITPSERWLKASFLSDVISGGILYSSSDGTWDVSIANQKYVNDSRYNISTPVVRVTSVPMNNDGEAYVYVYDLDPRSWKPLRTQMIMCYTGQKKSEIAFVTTSQTKTTLYSFNDVSDALLSGGEVTFSFNVYGKSEDNQFYYVTGRVDEFNFVHDDIEFSFELPDYFQTTVYEAKLSRDNAVSLRSYTINRKSHATTDLKPYNGSIESHGYYRFYRLD